MTKPLKVPSLARSVPKPLKVPSLARSVLKPLKEPTLARFVPKPLSLGLQASLNLRLKARSVPKLLSSFAVDLLPAGRRQRGTSTDSPKLIVGSEVRGTTPQS